jgi:LysM repeat protein
MQEGEDMAVRTNGLARAAVLLTVIVVFFLLLASAVGAQNVVVPTAEHRIVGGETLWSIALGVTPSGGDVRVTVSEIRRLNDLTGATIYPGDTLLIPAED